MLRGCGCGAAKEDEVSAVQAVSHCFARVTPQTTNTREDENRNVPQAPLAHGPETRESRRGRA